MAEREPMIQTIQASKAREQFSQLLNKVFRTRTRVIVEKSGVPVAAIISTQDLQRLAQLEKIRTQHFKALEDSWQAFEDVAPEEIEAEVASAVAAARKKQAARGAGRAAQTS
jgi:prevent-host-death family protein